MKTVSGEILNTNEHKHTFVSQMSNTNDRELVFRRN